MYRPAAFDVADEQILRAAIDAAGPAHVVTVHTTPNGREIRSSIVPLLLDRTAVSLVGHLARPNPQWRDVDADIEAVAIFTGPDAYISPSGYATKRETGKVVPTWNYEVVHVHGTLVVHDDIAWVSDIVRRLTDRHESRRAVPWSVDDAPADYIDSMARAIVGIELRISRIEGKHKLSQNRNAADIDGAIADLSDGTPAERAVAAAMQRARPATG
ncbi:MAG: FMN-binding negative transcriptional regulator [Ilumatobacteraceae bacterium]|nr:FMN-binding negative transcriptional regulator [Ilumatobacteraceae bacterium]